MSYNTRRGPGPMGHAGRRGPNNYNNPQLTPQKSGGVQQQKPIYQQPTKNEQQTPTRPQQAAQPQQAPPPAPTPAPAFARTVVPSQPQAPVKQEPVKNENPVEAEGQDGDKKKKFWFKQRLPKKERLRRRNMRLGKILQPKNALMVYNELVSKPEFEIAECTTPVGTQYKASTMVDGIEISGYGKNKGNAKNSAAENAIKHLIKTKKFGKFSEKVTNEDGTEAMDTSEETDETQMVPWQHVASFALFKLFSTWEDGFSLLGQEKKEAPVREQVVKPAKKLPDNAAEINPIMLLNQMCPQAKFEELPSAGQPPNCTFSYKCTIDNKPYIGTGTNKKIAKRETAYVACAGHLGVQYPPEVSSKPVPMVS